MANAFALVKRNDALGFDCFSGKVIREREVWVETGDRRVFPGSMKRLQAGADPALFVGVAVSPPAAVVVRLNTESVTGRCSSLKLAFYE